VLLVAVISLNHLGHAIEQTLWSVMVLLVALSLGLAWRQMPANIRILIGVGMAVCIGAALLMWPWTFPCISRGGDRGGTAAPIISR
jgi:uncharacterized membrane protein YadS